MHGHRFVTLALSAVALAACNPFHHDPPVMVSQTDVNVNTRWHGTLTTPATLAGAVQMTGTVSMAPGSNSGSTTVSLTLANATPGGVHPRSPRTTFRHRAGSLSRSGSAAAPAR